MLKFTNKRVISVQDWDELVQTTYGKPYMFQQQDGCQSRGTFDFSVPIHKPEDYDNANLPEEVNHEQIGVSFSAWLARDPKQPLNSKDEERNDQWAINLWWQRNFYPNIEMVIDDLYKKGLIQAGKYTIDIDW